MIRAHHAFFSSHLLFFYLLAVYLLILSLHSISPYKVTTGKEFSEPGHSSTPLTPQTKFHALSSHSLRMPYHSLFPSSSTHHPLQSSPDTKYQVAVWDMYRRPFFDFLQKSPFEQVEIHSCLLQGLDYTTERNPGNCVSLSRGNRTMSWAELCMEACLGRTMTFRETRLWSF